MFFSYPDVADKVMDFTHETEETIYFVDIKQ